MPDHRHDTPLEKRTRKQLEAIRSETLKAAKAIGKSYPNSARGNQILHQLEQRVQQLLQQGRSKQPILPPARRRKQSTELWTDSLPLKFLYSFAIACLFALFGVLFEWWALLIFPVGWAVSQSFLWTVTVPLSLLLLVTLLLSPFGM
jgi:hypothetical protein